MAQESNCPKCGSKNPIAAAFCGHCGAPLAKQGEQSKTIFGYMAPPVGQGAQAAPAAAPAPVTDDAPTQQYPAGTNLIAGRYWLASDPVPAPGGTLGAAKDTETDTDVDLFLSEADTFASPLDLERARRELRQIEKIANPHVVAILAHGKTEDDRLYVVTERAQGTPLNQLLAQSSIAVPQVKQILSDVGTALTEAQKVGVVHRDICPENILVGANRRASVRGFGTATRVSEGVYGSPHYISPEQAGGRPVDQRSNIYSLGAIVFQMLTCRPPFEGQSGSELLASHESAAVPKLTAINANTPNAVEALVEKALAKKPSDRHLTLRQFLREVEQLPDDGSTAATGAAFETPLHGLPQVQGDAPVESEAPPTTQPTGASAETLAPIAEPAPATQPDAAAGDAPVMASSAPTVAGELAGGKRVRIRKTGQHAPATAKEQADKQQASQPAAKKGGFRETMWFFKGEVESEMAAQGELKPAHLEEEPDAAELLDKYNDDGSLTATEAQRLSLRTGKTQMMEAVKIPDGRLPGARMDDKEFIGEMNTGKRYALWIGVAVAIAAVFALIAILI